MAILRFRDENGVVREVVALRGKDGVDAYTKAKEQGYTGTEASFYQNIGEKMKPHAFKHASDGEDPISPSSIGAAEQQHTHTTEDIVKGVLPVQCGGTGQTEISTKPSQGSQLLITSGGVYDALKAKTTKKDYEVVLRRGDWVPASDDRGWIQVVDITGMQEEDMPFVAIKHGDDILNEIYWFSSIYYIKTLDGRVEVWSYDEIGIDLTIILRVVI